MQVLALKHTMSCPVKLYLPYLSYYIGEMCSKMRANEGLAKMIPDWGRDMPAPGTLDTGHPAA